MIKTKEEKLNHKHASMYKVCYKIKGSKQNPKNRIHWNTEKVTRQNNLHYNMENIIWMSCTITGGSTEKPNQHININ